MAFHVLILTIIFIISTQGLCFGNLIPNPGFITSPGDELSPHFWHHGSTDIKGVKESAFSVAEAGNPPLRALGIKGGEDRSGEWWCELDNMKKGQRYILTFKAFRDEIHEGIFPEVELFKNRIRFNNHLTYGGWQDFTVIFNAIEEATTLKFINNNPVQFYFSSPLLVEATDKDETEISSVRVTKLSITDRLFPLIAYGAKNEDFPFIKDLGFNGIVAGVNKKNIDGIEDASRKQGLMVVARSKDEEIVRRLSDMDNLLGWYVEDEPEGRSVPVEYIKERVKMIREAGSAHPTFMAMLRPEFVEYYKEAADIILMDQYPVPHLPIIWLSKSMDYAKKKADGREIWAVIQVFGGQGWKGKGWDREPDYAEMRALSYLAIIHGARGLFFYTLKDKNYDLSLDHMHLNDVKRLIQELKFLSPFFLAAPDGSPDFNSDSLYEYSPDGSKPVHTRTFRDGKRLIMVAVNVLDKRVKGRLSGIPKDIRYFDEYFSGKRFVVKDENIIDDFGPYSVKIYMAGKEFRNVRITDGNADTVKALFYAEVAKTRSDKSRGLMFRGLPSEERALLFQLEETEDVEIYAMNVGDNFDLIFFDEDRRVSALYKNIAPCYDSQICSRYRSPIYSKTILELKAGVIDRLHIDVGDRLELY